MSASSAPILLVDDEPDVLLTLGMVLERAGYAVTTAATADLALRLAAQTDFHVALVDYRLAGSAMDGLELIARLQDANALTVAVLMTVYDRGAVGFQASQAGAFNYLVKPFSNQALLATVRDAVLERCRRERMRDRLHVGDLAVDLTGRQVHLAGEPVPLSDQEFDLLAYLASHPCRVVGYAELWTAVWGYDCPADKAVIRKAVSRLRKKLGRGWLVSVRRKGYRLR